MCNGVGLSVKKGPKLGVQVVGRVKTTASEKTGSSQSGICWTLGLSASPRMHLTNSSCITGWSVRHAIKWGEKWDFHLCRTFWSLPGFSTTSQVPQPTCTCMAVGEPDYSTTCHLELLVYPLICGPLIRGTAQTFKLLRTSFFKSDLSVTPFSYATC